MELALFILCCFIFLCIKGVFDRKKAKEQLQKKLKERFGRLPANEYTEEKYCSIQYYYRKQIAPNREESSLVDEITWNDLNMDHLFTIMNASVSSMGEEYLWALLHELQMKEDILKEREQIITFFSSHPEERLRLQTALAMIGKNKKTSVYEYMAQMKHVKKESNAKHFGMIAVIAAGVALLPFCGAVGGGVLIFAIAANILGYYKRKGETAPYFTAMSYIIRMLDHAAEISKERSVELQPYTEKLKKATSELKSLCKGAPVVAPQNVTGDMLSMFLDYVRILFHTDLIRFNHMIAKYEKKEETIAEVFESIGFLDAMCAIASFRAMLPYYTQPEFLSQKQVVAEELFHPFLSNPVPSGFVAKKSILLTGSNASGKSTFLKSVAINAILAQTIHTVCAKRYTASFFRVLSSMALSDDLLGGESYYIVEIRSLKRILETSKKAGPPVLGFVDEVLRGTNTVERIAASSRLLASVAEENALIFAATHDIELTYMLEEIFENHHFEEKITEGRISFDYRLKSGRATSQNAIQLLSVMGYPQEVVEKAQRTAVRFMETGKWRKIE